jgi:serine protease Do
MNRISPALLGVVLLAALPGLTKAEEGPEKVVPATRAEAQMSFAPLVKRAAPAVVNIYTAKVVRARQVPPLFDDPFFRRFFGENFGFDPGLPRQRIQNSLGSGVIVRSDGLIVTNNHVIQGADAVKVVLSDRREFEAALVGTDEKTDLAVLRIDAGGAPLPYLELGDTDSLEVGDQVLAIGNPFGVGQTVTSGIVSALARTQVGITDINSFIQTDAAINPGNSGGALVGMDGRLAGINTAIFSQSGGSHGIGFAIPANLVRSVIAGIVKGGRLVRPWFGATGQPMTADIAASLGLPRPAGVLIKEIHPGSPAAQAGLKVGDVVLAVDGREVDDPGALRYRFATLAIGTTATLRVLSRGKEKTLRIAVTPPPEDPPRDVSELTGPHPLAGAVVANLSPALADEIGLEAGEKGVVVLQVRRGSTAHRMQFRAGDRLLEVNGDSVESVAEIKQIMTRRANRWRITIGRNGQELTVVVNR